MTIIEMRNKRAKAFEAAKAFVESHSVDGILSAEDSATYNEMENTIKNYDEAIGRLERLENMEVNLSMPTSTPITEKPFCVSREKLNVRFKKVSRNDCLSGETSNSIAQSTAKKGQTFSNRFP